MSTPQSDTLPQLRCGGQVLKLDQPNSEGFKFDLPLYSRRVGCAGASLLEYFGFAVLGSVTTR